MFTTSRWPNVETHTGKWLVLDPIARRNPCPLQLPSEKAAVSEHYPIMGQSKIANKRRYKTGVKVSFTVWNARKLRSYTSLTKNTNNNRDSAEGSPETSPRGSCCSPDERSSLAVLATFYPSGAAKQEHKGPNKISIALDTAGIIVLCSWAFGGYKQGHARAVGGLCMMTEGFSVSPTEFWLCGTLGCV